MAGGVAGPEPAGEQDPAVAGLADVDGPLLAADDLPGAHERRVGPRAPLAVAPPEGARRDGGGAEAEAGADVHRVVGGHARGRREQRRRGRQQHQLRRGERHLSAGRPERRRIFSKMAEKVYTGTFRPNTLLIGKVNAKDRFLKPWKY